MFVLMDAPPQPAVIWQAAQAAGSIEEKLAQRAKADGWSESQAGWIGKLGAAAMGSQAGGSSLDAAYSDGKRALTIAYFDNALKEGKSRLVAFLTVVDLEKQVAVRKGERAPDYPDDWLKAAYVALAKAAESGATSAEQLEVGFASLRAQASGTK